MLDQLTESEWQDVIAYWVAAPRGELRHDIRTGLAALMPYSKDAAKHYTEALDLRGHDDDKQIEFLNRTETMPLIEILKAV